MTVLSSAVQVPACALKLILVLLFHAVFHYLPPNCRSLSPCFPIVTISVTLFFEGFWTCVSSECETTEKKDRVQTAANYAYESKGLERTCEGIAQINLVSERVT